jgi:mannose-6-phosphate isomerase-like protein (cupin superfamily)
MPVVEISKIKKFSLPGIVHQTLAGPDQGVSSFELWLETVAPGSGTPVHRHQCEEVFVVLRGSGQLTLAGRNYPFGPDTTLIVPPETDHQVINNGSDDLHFLVVLGAPAHAATPEGQPIPLPWQQS